MPSLFARLLATAGAGLLVAACGEAPRPAAGPPPPPAVTVATPTQRTIVDQDEYVGRFVAVDAVEIRSRVSGYLERVHFSDGQQIKEGELLFTIDRRPFQNAVDQARATLQQARANFAFSEGDLQRAQTLVKEKTISEQVFEQRVQAKRIAEASVLANEAAVRQAELELTFTELRAPVSGRIGDRRVSPGNLVTGGTGGNTTLLATIVSLDPIRFEFTFDEASYLRYKRLADSAQMPGRGSGLAVDLKLIDEQGFPHKGRLDFVDNVIDRSTGTIRGRAQFANPDSIFTPGMFGRIRLPGSAPYKALLVPDVAVATEQARKLVFVADAEDIARPRYVALGPSTEDGMRVIKEGLAEGDRVIVNGLARVRPGVKVKAQDRVPVKGGPSAKAE